MKVLSGIKDVDLKILQGLEDTDFEKVCSINKYIRKLCNDETFWLNRFIEKKNVDMEEIREIKSENGNFTYKEIYWYYFIGNAYEIGLIEAVKRNNMTLFRKLWESKPHDDENDDVEVNILLEIGNAGNKDVTTYMFSKEDNPEKKDNFRIIIMSTAGEEFRVWLFRTGILSYYQYVSYMIGEQQVYNVFDEDYFLKEIKKYLPKIKGSDYANLTWFVGRDIKPFNLDLSKKLLEILIKIIEPFLKII